jgi:hypothetical protein
MSRPIVVTACIFAPPNRGHLNCNHVLGTHVPVGEPSTASRTDIHGSHVAEVHQLLGTLRADTMPTVLGAKKFRIARANQSGIGSMRFSCPLCFCVLLAAVSEPATAQDPTETRDEAARTCIAEQQDQEYFEHKTFARCMVAKGHYGPTFQYKLPPGARFRLVDPAACRAASSTMLCTRRASDGSCTRWVNRLTLVPVPCPSGARSI